jgi:serine/threonine protein kinase
VSHTSDQWHRCFAPQQKTAAAAGGVAGVTHTQAIDLAKLLQPMLAWDPAERPTAAELLQHPYFSRLEQQGDQQLPPGEQQQKK